MAVVGRHFLGTGPCMLCCQIILCRLPRWSQFMPIFIS
jgi:hypothetical protein